MPWPGDILEFDIVGELPTSNGYVHDFTTCDYFSRYLFAIAVRNLDTDFTTCDYFSRYLFAIAVRNLDTKSIDNVAIQLLSIPTCQFIINYLGIVFDSQVMSYTFVRRESAPSGNASLATIRPIRQLVPNSKKRQSAQASFRPILKMPQLVPIIESSNPSPTHLPIITFVIMNPKYI